MKRWNWVIGLSLISCNVLATPSVATAPHTTRVISVKDPEQKNWKIEFVPLTEQDLIQFSDENGVTIPQNQFFPIADKFTYGFDFAAGANFDIIYALTAISQDANALEVGNPKCVFLFTGLKPAVPQNSVTNFAGAKCELDRDAAGTLNLILAK